MKKGEEERKAVQNFLEADRELIDAFRAELEKRDE